MFYSTTGGLKSVGMAVPAGWILVPTHPKSFKWVQLTGRKTRLAVDGCRSLPHSLNFRFFEDSELESSEQVENDGTVFFHADCGLYLVKTLQRAIKSGFGN